MDIDTKQNWFLTMCDSGSNGSHACTNGGILKIYMTCQKGVSGGFLTEIYTSSMRNNRNINKIIYFCQININNANTCIYFQSD